MTAVCPINGNIARDGERIYHPPGGAYYSRTKIDPSKGERMFCSEDEPALRGGENRRDNFSKRRIDGRVIAK